MNKWRDDLLFGPPSLRKLLLRRGRFPLPWLYANTLKNAGTNSETSFFFFFLKPKTDELLEREKEARERKRNR